MDTQSQTKRRLMILGGVTGLLGQAITRAANAGGYEVIAVGRKDFDPMASETLAEVIDEQKPDIVCNAVGYTKVDQAEEEEEEALLLNRVLPRALGRIVRERPHIYLMHFSTDFVFDGRKAVAYAETDPANPLSVYGRSKLEGERAILELQLERFCIIRTAWLFGPGKKNFVTTILDLCRQGKTLNVVHDQTGSPTYTLDLAAYSLNLAEAGGRGIFHIANSGTASWCELASEAVRLAQFECPVTPIPSREYPQKAARPAFSVLDMSHFTEVTGIKPRPWPQALADYIYSTTPH